MEEDPARYTISILAESCAACRDALMLLPDSDIAFDIKVLLSKSEGLLLTMLEEEVICESLLNDLAREALMLSEQVRRLNKT